jgi:hypothetical protein
MSSDKKASTDDAKAPNAGAKAPPTDDTSSKSSDSQNVPSSGGHEETGAEKFHSVGGSGGSASRTDHGYEALADH